MEKKHMSIVVEYGGVDELSGTVVKHLEHIQGCLNLIPEEFRETARIDFEDDDCCYSKCEISYSRIETDHEFEARINRDKLMITSNEVSEKAQLERLIAKYGIPE